MVAQFLTVHYCTFTTRTIFIEHVSLCLCLSSATGRLTPDSIKDSETTASVFHADYHLSGLVRYLGIRCCIDEVVAPAGSENGLKGLGVVLGSHSGLLRLQSRIRLVALDVLEGDGFAAHTAHAMDALL